MTSRVLALMGLALLVAACAPPAIVRDGVPMPYEDAAQQDLDRARAHVEAGEYKAAAATLERFLLDTPDSERLDEALFLLGEVYTKSGKRERSAEAYGRLVRERNRSRRAPEAALRAGRMYAAIGSPELGRRVVEAAPFSRASEAQRVELYRLLADLSRATGDYAEAVRALALTRRDVADEEPLREIDLELEELVRGRLRDGELARLAERLPRGPVYDRVLLELASRQITRGDFADALDTIDELPTRLRPADEALRQALRSRAQRGAETAVFPVGVALPLTGPYAGFGRQALRGLVLGFEVFADPPGRYRIVVRDTGGDPTTVGRAMRELISEGVRVIVGPMSSSVAAAGAPYAEQAGVPLLALARREDLPGLGDYVFRLGVAPSDQTELLANHAAAHGSNRRFAILYPRDPRGIVFKNLFWDEAERRGGTIVGVESYAVDAVDVQEEIRKLVGLHWLTDDERKLLAERDRLLKRPQRNAERLAELALAELPPYVDFDALFIPDVAERVALILPQLRYYDVQDVILLGPDDWNDPRLVAIAGRDARGAVFIGAFHEGSEEEHVRAFVARYYEAFGEAPELWAATSYDAASLVRNAVNRIGRPSAGQLRRAMGDVRDFQGVSGLTGFDADGVPRRELQLLQVRKGEIVVFVDAAESS